MKDPSLFPEPRPGGLFLVEELEQQFCHLLGALRRWMRAVLSDVFAQPDEAVLASLRAVGPKVGSPRKPRRAHLALSRIVIQFRFAGDLIGDEPLDREAALIGVRLGIERRHRISSV